MDSGTWTATQAASPTTVTAEGLARQHQGLTPSPSQATGPRGSASPRRQVDDAGPFPSRKDRSWLSLARTLPLDGNVPSPPAAPLPKPTATQLQNVAPAFLTAVLLTSQLIPQQEAKQWPLLVDCMGLTVPPIEPPQSRWPDIRLARWTARRAS